MNSTHRAFLALDLYAVDDTAAREAVDLAAASVIPVPAVVAIEASAPTRRRHDPGSLPTRPDEQGTWLAATDAIAAGAIVRAYLRTHDALLELGYVPTALPHRNKLEEIADRLDGGQELAPVLPEPGEVFPMHRGSRA
jgi:hypothetical protein